MAGTTHKPSREVYLELTRRITIEGGKAIPARCEPRKMEYPASADDEARKIAERGAYSCGCGDTRKVMIPYEHVETDDDGNERTFQRRYVACANCDAVSLQPRWVQGRWASA